MFSGSEVNCFEIARWFHDNGYIVDVFCFELNHLFVEWFRSINVMVTDSIDGLSKNYDLIWCQHYAVLNIVLQNNIKGSKIIFSSLSPFENFEFAPSYANSLSCCLANSLETIEQLVKSGVKEEKIILFPNSVDFKYFKSLRIVTKLQRIICVSNHPPSEIIELKKIFILNGIQFDIYGHNNDFYKLINAEVLSSYDIIVTIGKTVQYGMAIKVPVYCYDYFGGPGWITQDNNNLAFEKNYSGRGFFKKNSQTIYNDIVNGFDQALSLLENNYKFCLQNFNLHMNIQNILSSINDSKNINSNELGVSVELFYRVFKLWQNLDRGIEELQSRNKELQYLYDGIINSTSWKIIKFARNFFNFVNIFKTLYKRWF